MTLSIIIPVFNEVNTVAQALEQVFKAPILDYNKEVIVVDDDSQDGSQEILQELQNKYNFIFLKHNKNLGKGAAVKTGLEKATGDLILIHDADLEYDPNDWQRLLQLFSNPEVKVVYGSRNLEPKQKGYWYCALGVSFLTALVNLFFKTKLTLSNNPEDSGLAKGCLTGLTPSNNFSSRKISFAKQNCLTGLTDIYTCTKIFRAPVIKSLNLISNNFDIEPEITVKLLKQGIKIFEMPIDYYPRTRRQGKKIRMKDGLSGFLAIIKYYLSNK